MSGGEYYPAPIAVLLCLLAFLSAGESQAAESTNNASAQDKSLAVWPRIATVLQHPRCLNCHQQDVPLQGDAARRHIPLVVRGPDNHGVGAMRCGNCHNESGNNEASRTPGAPHWALAPAPMLWQGLSSAELCRSLKDPKRNGNRDGDALLKHMADDLLVLWGWQPGASRRAVPLPHNEFVELMRTWVAGGMTCPT